MFSLAGCGNTNKLAEYDMTGISFISYADIDTVCEDEELTTAGKIYCLNKRRICFYLM